jgi:hypothetical protein
VRLYEDKKIYYSSKKLRRKDVFTSPVLSHSSSSLCDFVVVYYIRNKCKVNTSRRNTDLTGEMSKSVS